MTERTEDERRAALLAENPHLADFFPFLDETHNESDRGLTLIVASFLDDQLEDILGAFLIEGKAADNLLRGYNAPLGTLSARIDAAFSLGLISKEERAELERIRKIRNHFAHTVQARFSDDKISGLCRALTMDAKPYGGMTWNAKGAFTSAAMCLILNLVNRAHYVGQERRTWTHWRY